jgi:hypothetical protein
MKLRFAVTHTFRETVMPVLLDSWVTDTSVKMLCPQKNCFYSYFRKIITFLNVDLSRIDNRVQICIGGLLQLRFHDQLVDNIPISNVTFLVPVVY